MERQTREGPYTVAIAVGGRECVASGHTLVEVQHGLVCEDCSKVAARAVRRGGDPESAVEAFRRGRAGDADRDDPQRVDRSRSDR